MVTCCWMVVQVCEQQLLGNDQGGTGEKEKKEGQVVLKSSINGSERTIY